MTSNLAVTHHQGQVGQHFSDRAELFQNCALHVGEDAMIGGADKLLGPLDDNAIERELSDLERQVLDLYITGMSIKEVSAVLGRDEKSTDNAMQRIKTKLKKYLRK